MSRRRLPQEVPMGLAEIGRIHRHAASTCGAVLQAARAVTTESRLTCSPAAAFATRRLVRDYLHDLLRIVDAAGAELVQACAQQGPVAFIGWTVRLQMQRRSARCVQSVRQLLHEKENPHDEEGVEPLGTIPLAPGE